MAVTENITVLFTDLVGSTELASFLSPEAGDEIRRDHFSVLRRAIAETGGTEVKNLGDGIMVVFPVASAALACAVAMQQGVDRDNLGLVRPLGLRVGLSNGEATREVDDYFGDPVIEAARLCAKADGGQILAADLVRASAGRRTQLEFRSLGEMSLKGLPELIDAVEILWEPLGEGGSEAPIPLPGRLTIRSGQGVVGRKPDLAQIAEATKRVANGEGREVLLVSGEAGLGKTTVVAEASRAAFDSGAMVLFGHCEEDLATPYQLFAEALGHYVTHAPEDQLLAHVAVHGSELAKLTPTLANRAPDLPRSKATDSDTERFLLYSALVGLLAQVSEHQPVVLVLDDLQWADRGSLALLRHLVSADQALNVLILGTYRDSELSQGHPLTETLAALHRQRGISRIDLAGLDDDGIVALMEAAAGHAMDDAGVSLAHALYRETDGNPFFVGEVLRHLTETGAIYQDPTGRWVADGGLEQMDLPDSVRVVVGARVGRLGPGATKVLATAAVIGRDFDLDVLAKATRTDEDDLLDILEAATSVALVREPTDASGRYSFTHALIQRTLAEDLGPNRRARAHRQIAEALEALCGDRPGARVGELTRHWLSATQPIDITKAVGYARQAGDAALAALAPDDALSYYAQALDLYPQVSDPDPLLSLDLAIGLGTSQCQTGDPAFRDTLVAAAHRAADLSDTPRLTAAALALDRGIYSNTGVIDTEKVAILEQVLDRLAQDHRDRALVLASLCSEVAMGSPLERRQALADEAIASAEAFGDDAIMVRVLNNIYAPLAVPPLLQQSLVRVEDALVRADRLGDPILRFWAALNGTAVHSTAGNMVEFDRCLQIAVELAEQIDQPFLRWYAAIRRAFSELVAGDSDHAERLATEALQIATDSGQPDAMTLFGFQFMVASLQRGTMGELAALIEQQAAEMPDVDQVARSASLALAHAEGHRTDEAASLLDLLAQVDFEITMDQAWSTAIVLFADAAILVGDPKYAGPILDQLRPYADQVAVAGSVAALGPISYYLGGLASVVGLYDEADRYFNQAEAVSERMDAKFFAARTDLLWGKMLAQRNATGDSGKARDLLTKAHAAAVEYKYGNLERRAAEPLEHLGA